MNKQDLIELGVNSIKEEFTDFASNSKNVELINELNKNSNIEFTVKDVYMLFKELVITSEIITRLKPVSSGYIELTNNILTEDLYDNLFTLVNDKNDINSLSFIDIIEIALRSLALLILTSPDHYSVFKNERKYQVNPFIDILGKGNVNTKFDNLKLDLFCAIDDAVNKGEISGELSYLAGSFPETSISNTCGIIKEVLESKGYKPEAFIEIINKINKIYNLSSKEVRSLMYRTYTSNMILRVINGDISIKVVIENLTKNGVKNISSYLASEKSYNIIIDIVKLNLINPQHVYNKIYKIHKEFIDAIKDKDFKLILQKRSKEVLDMLKLEFNLNKCNINNTTKSANPKKDSTVNKQTNRTEEIRKHTSSVMKDIKAAKANTSISLDSLEETISKFQKDSQELADKMRKEADSIASRSYGSSGGSSGGSSTMETVAGIGLCALALGGAAYLGYRLYDNYVSDKEMADIQSYGCGVI